MTEKTSWDNQRVLTHTYLKYKGVYSWKSLMRFMRGWIEKNHYVYYEKKYKEKPGQYGTEVEWKVEAEKKVDGYYRYWIKWELRIWDQVPVELIKEDRKVIMEDGRIRIMINTVVEMDYDQQFEGKTIFKKMEKFLTEKILLEEINSIHWDGLYYEMNRFKNEIEAHLGMETATIGSPYH